MKHCLILLALFLNASVCLSQDYVDAVTTNACECAEKISDITPAKDASIQFGLCIIGAAAPHKSELKKDHGIDLNNVDKEDGERLGVLIATRMVQICPKTLVKISNSSQTEKKERAEHTVEGVVSKVEKDFFVVFSLRETSGKTTKLYWMTPIKSSMDLTNNYSSLVGKSLKVTYEAKDFFDPKIADYRQFNVILKIK